MAIRRSDRERQRRAFLHALKAGRTVSEAAEHAGIPWSTLYSWRQKSPSFAGAWDRAAEYSQDGLIDRLQSALIQRAVEGVDEPVFHAGERVGTRKRYSDALLLGGLRQLIGSYGFSSGSYTLPEPLELPPPGRALAPPAPARSEPAKPNGPEPAPRHAIAPLPVTPALAASATEPAIAEAEVLEEKPAMTGPESDAPELAPPEPAEERALDWSHLGRREDDGRW